MKLVTLGQLIADARLYADQRTSNGSVAFITDVEVARLINLQIGELYDMLVAARGHEYYATDDTITLDGSASYDLPEDFYQLLSVEIEHASDDVEPVSALNSPRDVWSFASESWQPWTRKAYRIRGSQIDFFPTPGSGTVRLRYVPVFTDLTGGEGEAGFDGVNGWEKLVALGVASEMLEIEEQGAGAALQAAFARQIERIEGLAADRDATEEIEIRDVRRSSRRYPPATVVS